MAHRTIMRLYDAYDAVVQIVHRLELAGVPDRDISVITSNVESRYPVLAEAAQSGSSPLRAGALTGAGLGGCCVALLGIGAIAVPGVDPVAQSGWFAALLVGAVVGGLAGATIGLLARLLMRRDPATAYARGISRGNTLLTVRVDERMVARVESLMGITEGGRVAAAPRPVPLPLALSPARTQEQVDGYGVGGWSRLEPAGYVTPADLDAERRRIDAANERIQNG